MGSPIPVVLAPEHRALALALSANKKMSEGVRVALEVVAILGIDEALSLLAKNKPTARKIKESTACCLVQAKNQERKLQ